MLFNVIIYRAKFIAHEEMRFRLDADSSTKTPIISLNNKENPLISEINRILVSYRDNKFMITVSHYVLLNPHSDRS